MKIAYAEFVEGFPRRGVMAFRRIVPPQSTLGSDEDGKFIFPPDGSFIIFLVSPKNEIVQAEVAFGWFEKKKGNSIIKQLTEIQTVWYTIKGQFPIGE